MPCSCPGPGLYRSQQRRLRRWLALGPRSPRSNKAFRSLAVRPLLLRSTNLRCFQDLLRPPAPEADQLGPCERAQHTQQTRRANTREGVWAGGCSGECDIEQSSLLSSKSQLRKFDASLKTDLLQEERPSQSLGSDDLFVAVSEASSAHESPRIPGLEVPICSRLLQNLRGGGACDLCAANIQGLKLPRSDGRGVHEAARRQC